MLTWWLSGWRALGRGASHAKKPPSRRRVPLVAACRAANRSGDELMSLAFCWKMCRNCPGYRARLCSPLLHPHTDPRCLFSSVSNSLHRITLRNLGISIPRRSKNIFCSTSCFLCLEISCNVIHDTYLPVPVMSKFLNYDKRNCKAVMPEKWLEYR